MYKFAVHLHCIPRNEVSELTAVILPVMNQFSFHWQTWTICSSVIIKDATTPEMHRLTVW